MKKSAEAIAAADPGPHDAGDGESLSPSLLVRCGQSPSGALPTRPAAERADVSPCGADGAPRQQRQNRRRQGRATRPPHRKRRSPRNRHLGRSPVPDRRSPMAGRPETCRCASVKAARITDSCIPCGAAWADCGCHGYFIGCRAPWTRPAGSPIIGGVDAPGGYVSEGSRPSHAAASFPPGQAARRATHRQAAPFRQSAWPRTRAAGSPDARSRCLASGPVRTRTPIPRTLRRWPIHRGHRPRDGDEPLASLKRLPTDRG